MTEPDSGQGSVEKSNARDKGRRAASKVQILFKRSIGPNVIHRIQAIFREAGVDYTDWQFGGCGVSFELSAKDTVDYQCLERIKQSMENWIRAITVSEIKGEEREF